MIRDQRLLQQLMELNTLEQVFKQVYLLRRQYGQVEKLNHILVRMGIQAEQYWMPGVNMDQDIYLTQNLSYDVVGLEKAPVNFGLHPRYQSYSLHRHTFFECMIVLRGACQNIVEGSSMDLREGEICMIPPYVRHMVGVYDDESIVANLLFTREHLTGRLLQILPKGCVLTEFLRACACSDSAYDEIRIDTGMDPEVLFLTEQLLREYFRPDGSDCACYEALLTALLLRLILCANGRMICAASSYHRAEQAADILYYLQTHYRRISLQETAVHFNYAPSYLGRRLKTDTGSTFTELLRQIRISQACYYLCSSQVPIGAIPELVGYESQSYFTQLFKRITGMTPSVFRKAVTLPPETCVPLLPQQIAQLNFSQKMEE